MKYIVVFCLALIALARGDTPANCYYTDIEGTWTVSETDRIYDNTLSCEDVSAMNFPYTKSFTFSYPDVVSDELGNLGSWTIVYNQGFEFTINERSYFAFSLYEVLENETVNSYCDQVIPGWSRDKTVRNWSCFTAQKDTPVAIRMHDTQDADFEKQYQNDHKLIETINSIQSTWKAKAYPQFEEFTVGEMVARAGGLANAQVELPPVAPATEQQKERAAYLPVNFDWRNVSGVNYVSPVRDQASCGSCYAFASLAGIEARLRIATKNQRQDVFSTQDILECSVLSQGCAGGFNYLIAGRYAQDQGVVDESCNLYEGVDGECTTDASCTRTYVSDYDYVGGYYGASNEELMMEALVTGGPYPVSYMVHADFYAYSEGIYSHTSARSDFNPLVVVSHAVLLVGYGEDQETGMKYWTCKNSWSEDWGEDGFFRIVRGINDCGIESAGFVMTAIP